MKRLLSLLFCLLAAPFLLGQTAQPEVERRMALVIGNDSYRQMPLRNSVRDAQALGEALRDLDFEVVTLANRDRTATKLALEAFLLGLRPGDVALFYYAGHAIQVDGENYLLGVDTIAGSEEEAVKQGLPAGQVLARIHQAQSRMAVVILDACRDNPFRRGTRSFSGGLSAMSAGQGSYIAFATEPGRTAADSAEGQGAASGHGLFTACLLENLKTPGMDLNRLFDETREQVYAASRQQQLPWTASSLVGSFVFNNPSSRGHRLARERVALEESLARLQGRHKEAQDRNRAAEAQRQEQDLKDRLALNVAESKRLLAERNAEDQRRAASSLQEQEAARTAAEGERQRRETAARLDQTERRLAAERAQIQALRLETLRLPEAVQEVATLESGLRQQQLVLDTERKQSLERLASDYSTLQKKLSQPLVKDYFESSAAFQLREESQAARVSKLQDSERRERAELERRLNEVGEAHQAFLAARIADLRSRAYPMSGVVVEWGQYDADAGVWPVTLNLGDQSLATGSVQVSPEQARRLDSRRAMVSVEATHAYGESTQAALKTAQLRDPQEGLLQTSFRFKGEADLRRTSQVRQQRPDLQKLATDFGGRGLGFLAGPRFDPSTWRHYSDQDRLQAALPLAQNALAVAILEHLGEDPAAAIRQLHATREQVGQYGFNGGSAWMSSATSAIEGWLAPFEEHEAIAARARQVLSGVREKVNPVTRSLERLDAAPSTRPIDDKDERVRLKSLAGTFSKPSIGWLDRAYFHINNRSTVTDEKRLEASAPLALNLGAIAIALYLGEDPGPTRAQARSSRNKMLNWFPPEWPEYALNLIGEALRPYPSRERLLELVRQELPAYEAGDGTVTAWGSINRDRPTRRH